MTHHIGSSVNENSASMSGTIGSAASNTTGSTFGGGSTFGDGGAGGAAPITGSASGTRRRWRRFRGGGGSLTARSGRVGVTALPAPPSRRRRSAPFHRFLQSLSLRPISRPMAAHLRPIVSTCPMRVASSVRDHGCRPCLSEWM